MTELDADLLRQQAEALSPTARWLISACLSVALAALAVFRLRQTTAAMAAAGIALMAALVVGLVEQAADARTLTALAERCAHEPACAAAVPERHARLDGS